MAEHTKHLTFKGKILMVGFGAVGQGTLPLLRRHIDMPKERVKIITAEDWGREIAEGSLLAPATQAERLKARRFNGVPVNLGYGLGCERVNDFTGHNGAIYGFSTVVFRYPPDDLTLAVVGNESTNSTTPTSTFGYQFIRQFYPAQWT